MHIVSCNIGAEKQAASSSFLIDGLGCDGWCDSFAATMHFRFRGISVLDEGSLLLLVFDLGL